MLLVLVILSFLMFIIYNMVPSNRAYTDAKAEIQTMKKGMSATDMDTRFQELYLKYQRRYGTDTNNMVIRYLRWVGLYPLYDGSYSGLLQGNFGYSYEARDEVITLLSRAWPIPYLSIYSQPFWLWESLFLWASIVLSRKTAEATRPCRC